MKELKMLVNPQSKKSHINKEIYGHFSEHLGRCIYNGLYVGNGSKIPNTDGVRDDVIKALKEIKIPVLRWPGGCFADEYHWKDGIGSNDERKKMINTNWGGVVEDNSFGTHEFMNMCEKLDCEPYIAGNLGSGTVQELSEWVEYMTFDGVSPMADLRKKNGRDKPWKLKYLGIGNENWGCGGSMRPEFYADEYRRYQSFCKNYSGNELYKVACGPNSDDYNWTEKLLESVNEWHTKAISLHYYTIPTGDWSNKGSATEFSDKEYYETVSKTLYMDTLITRHGEIMNRFDPEHKIGLIVDEWGCWYDVEEGTNPGFLYQQNSMRDAIISAVNLNIFNEHSDRIVMANLAQMVNVLQAVILTEGDKLVLTPTYHVFDLYKEHQDNELIDSWIESSSSECEGVSIPEISKSVSVDKNNNIIMTLANCSLYEDVKINCTTFDFSASKATGRIVNANARAYNTFVKPENVTACEFNDISIEKGMVSFTMPACSVVSIRLEK